MTDTKPKFIQYIEGNALAYASAMTLTDNADGDVELLMASLQGVLEHIGDVSGLCPGCLALNLAQNVEHAAEGDEDKDVDAELDSVVDELDAASAPKQIH